MNIEKGRGAAGRSEGPGMRRDRARRSCQALIRVGAPVGQDPSYLSRGSTLRHQREKGARGRRIMARAQQRSGGRRLMGSLGRATGSWRRRRRASGARVEMTANFVITQWRLVRSLSRRARTWRRRRHRMARSSSTCKTLSARFAALRRLSCWAAGTSKCERMRPLVAPRNAYKRARGRRLDVTFDHLPAFQLVGFVPIAPAPAAQEDRVMTSRPQLDDDFPPRGLCGR